MPPPIPLFARLEHQLYTRYPQEHTEGFLGPLSTLRLHNISIGCGVTAHRGLFEIYIEPLPGPIASTVSQFADVLRETPMVWVLKLARISFRSIEM